MGKAIFAAIVVAVLAVGAGIYAWGWGMFRPCEPLGRIFAQGQCTSLLSLNDRWIGGVASLPNGNLLVAASAPQNAAGQTGSLIEISAADGALIDETPLPPNTVETGFVDVAVNMDGTLVAVAMSFREGQRRYGIQVFDRSGALVSDIPRGLPGFMKFDADNRLIVHPGGFDDAERPAALAEAFALDDPQTALTLQDADLAGLFQRGLNNVVSPDGSFAVMLMDGLIDDPYVGLRAIPTDQREDQGTLFATALGKDCNYILSDLAISPGGKIAAEFDCPDRFGIETTALLVWDYPTTTPLLRLPTIDPLLDPLWLDESTLIATRWNYGSETHEVLRIAVPDAD